LGRAPDLTSGLSYFEINMSWVYILKTQKDKYYIGST